MQPVFHISPDLHQSTQDFVFLVLMCGWLEYVTFDSGKGWTVVDLFSGEERISKLAAKVGFKTASIDVKIPGVDTLSIMAMSNQKKRRFPGPQRNLMDINGHSGLPFLGCGFFPTCQVTVVRFY